MVKGCSKRIIMINNTESRYFDTAYFILKSDLPASCSERDMLNEAQTIVDACSVEKFLSQNETVCQVMPDRLRKGSAKKHRVSSVVAFFSGAATVGVIAAAISIIANLLY